MSDTAPSATAHEVPAEVYDRLRSNIRRGAFGDALRYGQGWLATTGAHPKQADFWLIMALVARLTGEDDRAFGYETNGLLCPDHAQRIVERYKQPEGFRNRLRRLRRSS